MSDPLVLFSPETTPPWFLRHFLKCPVALEWFHYENSAKYLGGPSTYVKYGALYIFGIRVAIWRRNPTP
jgi:hypothetical protein